MADGRMVIVFLNYDIRLGYAAMAVQLGHVVFFSTLNEMYFYRWILNVAIFFSNFLLLTYFMYYFLLHF